MHRHKEEEQRFGGTVGGFLSRQSSAVPVLIVGDHGHLEERLWTQAVQQGRRGVAGHRHLSTLLREHGLPSDLVRPDIPRSRCPRRCEAAVRDLAGDQVSGWTHL